MEWLGLEGQAHPNYGNVDNAVATVAATSATEAIAVGLFNNGVDRALAIQFA